MSLFSFPQILFTKLDFGFSKLFLTFQKTEKADLSNDRAYLKLMQKPRAPYLNTMNHIMYFSRLLLKVFAAVENGVAVIG